MVFLVDLDTKITNGASGSLSNYMLTTDINNALNLKVNNSTLNNYTTTGALNILLALKANLTDLTTTSNSVTNNIALISALQTKCGGIGTWSANSSYYAFFNPSVNQTNGDNYSLIQHSAGRTYLSGVGNLDLHEGRDELDLHVWSVMDEALGTWSDTLDAKEGE